MAKVSVFFNKLSNQLDSLKRILSSIFSQAELVEDNVLVKSGFIIRRYEIRLSEINLDVLQELEKEIDQILVIENDIRYNINQVEESLQSVVRDYNLYLHKDMNLERIFKHYLNNAFYLSRIIKNRIYQLTKILKTGVKLHKANIGKDIENILKGLEKEVNQVIRFIDLIDQLEKRITDFERINYFDNDRTYGRAMSKSEEKITKAKSELIGSPKRGEEDLISVFDYNSYIKNKLSGMSEDQLKTFFGEIGVVGAIKVLVFKTKLKPVAGPIPQSNQLIEYKFPKNIHIEIAA